MSQTDQLPLDLRTCESSTNRENPSKSVVSFVDAATMTVRQEAVARVISSGIFEPPAVPRQYFKNFR